MNRQATILLVPFCIALLAACASTGAPADEQSAPADMLAQQVVQTTGDPSVLEELAFTFVVEKDGEQVVRRRHVWRPRAGELIVQNGEHQVAFDAIDEHDLSELVAEPGVHADTWREVAPDASPEDAAQAWAWFINDSYWLLAPAKLFDPGVNRTLDDQGRLVLTFDEIGVTPGDRYALEIDRTREVVTGWEFTLESGNEGAFDWTGYKSIGPLMLSTRKIAREGDTVIRFDGIVAVQ